LTTIAEVQRLLAEAIDACNKLGSATAHAVLDRDRETHTDDTLFRVAEGLRRGVPALNQQGITDLINGMHNEGILFRERTPDLTDKTVQADIENVRDKPWKPIGSDGASATLFEAVGQALGSASMAWEHVDRAGVFDEAWCGKVYDGLMAFLADWGAEQRREANEATVAKASTEARYLIAYAFHLRHGKRAPGGDESWAEFDRRAENFLRGTRAPRWPAGAEVLHRPRRGGDVEAWLKGHRDRHVSSEGLPIGAWYAVDDLLDDYREHADHGTPLDRRPDGLPYGGDRK
jgi:hypothetical protein